MSNEFLEDKPLFADIVDEFLEFIDESSMVIHNAPFDMGFINSELKRLGRQELPMSRATDTLTMARRKFPGAQANLNALCRRFDIDNSHRDLHGALVDADLLASVYLELLGGRQRNLSLEPDQTAQKSGNSNAAGQEDGFVLQADSARFDRPHEASDAEKAAHLALLDKLQDPVWNR